MSDTNIDDRMHFWGNEFRHHDEIVKLHAEVAELIDEIEWGTKGLCFQHNPPKIVKLVSLETSHLENILIGQPHIGNFMRAAILHILRERYAKEEAQRLDKVLRNYIME